MLLLTAGYGQKGDYIKPNILHSPVTGIFEGQTITIEAVVTDNQEVEEVILYYRNRGEEYYKYLSMELEFNNYILDIPEEDIDTTGVEYYIEARDASDNRAFSPVFDPEDDPHFVKYIPLALSRGPELLLLNPEPNSVVDNGHQVIVISIYDTDDDVDPTTGSLIIDGVDVTHDAIITHDLVTYTPFVNFPVGKHTVEFFIMDEVGNMSLLEYWLFTVEEIIIKKPFWADAKIKGAINFDSEFDTFIGKDQPENRPKDTQKPKFKFSYTKDNYKVSVAMSMSKHFDGLANSIDARRQPLGRFKFAVEVPYFTLKGGDQNPNFSELTLKGARIRGLIGEARYKGFGVTGIYGKAKNMITSLTDLLDTVTDTVYTSAPTFEWAEWADQFEGDTLYQLQISEDESFSIPLEDVIQAEASFVYPNSSDLNIGTIYYWRVRPLDEFENPVEDWSLITSFLVKDPTSGENTTVSKTTREFDHSKGTFKRTMWGVNTTYGKKDLFEVGVNFLQVSDDTTSFEDDHFGDFTQLDTDRRSKYKAQWNRAVGLNGRLAMFGSEVKAYWATSVIHQDIISDGLIEALWAPDASMMENLKNGALLVEWSSRTPFADFKGTYKRTPEKFNSLGNASVQTDITGFKIDGRTKLFSNQIMLSGGYETQHDNLDKLLKQQTTTNQTYSGTMNLGFSNLPGVNLGYRLMKRAGAADIPVFVQGDTVFTVADTSELKLSNDQTSTITVGPSYSLKLGGTELGLSGNVMLMAFDDQNNSSANFNSNSYMGAVSLSFPNALSINLGYGISENIPSEGSETVFNMINGKVGYSLFDKKLKLYLGTSIVEGFKAGNGSFDNGEDFVDEDESDEYEDGESFTDKNEIDNNKFNMSFGFQYKISKNQVIGLDIGRVSVGDALDSSKDYSEIKGKIKYKYTL